MVTELDSFREDMERVREDVSRDVKVRLDVVLGRVDYRIARWRKKQILQDYMDSAISLVLPFPTRYMGRDIDEFTRAEDYRSVRFGDLT